MAPGLLLPFKGSIATTQGFGSAGTFGLEPAAWLLREAGKPWRANLDELAGAVELPHVHLGVDYGTPTGTKLYAPAAGKIVREYWDSRGGRVLELKIPGRATWLLFAHLSGYELPQGATVDAGELIARSGASGKVTGAHLHFEIIHGADRSRYNPRRLLVGADHAGAPWITPG